MMESGAAKEGDDITSIDWSVILPFPTHWQRDGSRIVSASYNGEVRVWSRTGELQQQLGEFQHPVFTACFSPSSERLLVSGALSSFLIYRREGAAWKVEADTTVVNEWEKNHHGLLQLNMNRGGVATS